VTVLPSAAADDTRTKRDRAQYYDETSYE